MSMHQSGQKLEFYGIISWLRTISHSRSMLGRTVVGCPSNANLQFGCLSTPLHHLSAKLCSMSVHQSVQKLEFCHIIGRLRPIIWHSRGMFGRAVVGCPLNAHPQTSVSINFSPSPLSVKLRSMSLHRSVQKLEFCCIISSLGPYHTVEKYLGGP